MIAFASRIDARPFPNRTPPDVPFYPLGTMRKCVTPGCFVHIAPGPYCGDCRQATVPLREWRRAVDAGEIVR